MRRQATATPGQLAGRSPTCNEQSHERSRQRALVGLLKKKRLGLFKISSKQKGLPEDERNEYVKRFEDWSTFATNALPAGPQLEQQEEGEEAVQEFETVPTERLERPDKRRNQQNARTGILGGNPDLVRDHDKPLASRADAGAKKEVLRRPRQVDQ